ncbi:hypothetical protein [Streptomyces sp. NBC_01768]|uniref:hypothetical protein n=1 Tax=Streptomyces sp. NBC_01768 TaxID=2975938 RepID=UPI002DD84F66|nr:hypothetical protein [Streptomyces sp. NBC_01768]WSC31793.1 hypothetical protein OG902_36670 [Streptomyces sp. NBC_01768]
MEAAKALGAMLAETTSSKDFVSAQVVDVTDEGVNLMLSGALVTDVPCATSYVGRAAGDWVAVRIAGGRPVVAWRLGEDRADATAAQMQSIAVDAAEDVQVVRAVTWGTGAPSGLGWQSVATPFARKVNGKVELYLQLGSQSDTPPTPPATKPPRPVSISPSSSGSWRNGRPDDYASDPTQGDWTGRGDRRGAWFYGMNIASACAGKTVSSMSITVTRKRGSGVNAKRPVHFYLHNYTSSPSGQLNLGDGPEELMSLSVGGKATAKLPVSWRNALASGSARGIAVYSRGSRDYGSYTGGSISITFGL